jgi:hypothetical protein
MPASIDRRQFIAALPALAVAPRILAQTPPAKFRVNGLSQITLTVSDVARSLDFYQGLFGTPVQARQGSTVLLRIGNGPRFIALRQATAGEKPSISALGFGVQDFSIDRAMQTLTAKASAPHLQMRRSPDRSRHSFVRGAPTKADRRMAARAICSPPIRAASSSSCTT